MPRRPSSPAAGFTLVEVIIALSLVALIMLGLVSALATFGRTASSLEGRNDRAEEVRLVSNFLRGILGSVPLRYRLQEAGMAEQAMFIGHAGELQWLGVMPARYGMGGLHHFRLAAEGSGQGAALFLQYAPFYGGEARPDWAMAQARVLAEWLEYFQVQYADEEEGEWVNEWVDRPRPPDAVRIVLASDGAYWPDLIVRIRPQGGSGGVRIMAGPDLR